jgi:Fur family ferric uptake transcriptional regulator
MAMNKANERLKEEFKQILESTGQRFSREQEALLDLFCEADKHLSVSELSEKLRKAGFAIDDAVIEQTLELFCNYGIAEKKTFKDIGTVYEHRHIGTHHDHCICIKCGGIREIFDSRIEALQDEAAGTLGFRPIRHKLEIYGFCEKCAGKRRKTFALSSAPAGERVRVIRIAGGHGAQQRLTDLGILPGTELEVIHTVGPYVVAVKGSRIALGHGVVHKIIVEPLESA